jgi:hypothetical protein
MWSGSGSYRTEEDRRRWRRSGGRRNMPDERWREEDEYMDRGDRYSGSQGYDREPMSGRGQGGSQYGSEERSGRRYGGAPRSSYGSPGNHGTSYGEEYDEGERDYYGPSSSYETGRRWQEESPRSGGRDIEFNRGRGWYQDRGSSEQFQDGGMGRGSQMSRWGRNQGLYGPTEYAGGMSGQRMEGESYAGRRRRRGRRCTARGTPGPKGHRCRARFPAALPPRRWRA